MRLKIALLLFVIGIMFLFSCQPYYPLATEKGTLTAIKMTTVKAEPDFNASDVATIKQNEQLILVQRMGDWYRVRLHNKQEGWIHKTLVKTNVYKDRVTTGEIGLRWKPTESSAVSQIVSPGTQVKVLQDAREWLLIQPVTSNNMGWVSRTDYNRYTRATSTTSSQTVGPQTSIYSASNVLLFTNTDSNIRSGPSTQDAIVTRVKKGTKLGWQSSVGDWYSITVSATNVFGYIYRPLVTTEPYQNIATQNECNFRAGPGLNYEVVDKLPKGTQLNLLDINQVDQHDWYLVQRPGGSLAWVRSDQTDMPAVYSTGAVSGKASFGHHFVVSNANVSRTAGEFGGLVTTLVPGQNVEILSSKTANWYQIRYNQNKQGYIKVENVTGVRSKPLIVSRSVNLRENASEKSAILARVPAGSYVMLMGVQSGWCFVKYNANDGWIAGSYLIPQRYHSVFVSKEKSFFRQTPSQNAATLGELLKGEEIYFFEAKNNWYRFKDFSTGQSVWISGNEVDLPRYGFGFAKQAVTPNSGPGLQYPQVPLQIRPNIRLPIIKEMLEWYQVMIPGHKKMGWVQKDMITRSSDRLLIILDESETLQRPEEGSGATGQLEKGTQVLELEYKNGWHYVASFNEKNGWLGLGWISSAKVAPTRYGQTTVSRTTNVYYGPSSGFATKLSLQRGTAVQIIDILDRWYQIDYFNQTGWIKAQ